MTGLAVAVATPGIAAAAAPAVAGGTTAIAPGVSENAPGVSEKKCPPHGAALGYSDALNKAVVDGTTIGGLSALAYDPRRHAYATIVDRTGTLPARIWFITDPATPKVVGSLQLRTPAGVPYDGTNFDGEGLAVLPDGRYLVSSESEPSLRIFDRTGTERGTVPVPDRFRVAPAGEAADNATRPGDRGASPRRVPEHADRRPAEPGIHGPGDPVSRQ